MFRPRLKNPRIFGSSARREVDDRERDDSAGRLVLNEEGNKLLEVGVEGLFPPLTMN